MGHCDYRKNASNIMCDAGFGTHASTKPVGYESL